MRKVLFLTALALLGCRRGLADQGPSVKQAPALSAHRVLSAEELFKKVSPSVFVVLALDTSKHPVEQGSAVVVGKGLLETNYHVVRHGTIFQVHHGTKSWAAKLVATNPDRDIAELKVPRLNAPAVPLRRFDSLVVGEKVYAVGAPEGLELTLSEGLVSSLRHSGYDQVIQTTAAISPGSSGGGLFDATGQLVGITVAYLDQGQNLNFALPTDSLSSARSASDWARLGLKSLAASRKFMSSSESDMPTDERDFNDWIRKNIDEFDEAKRETKQAVGAFRQSLRLDRGNETAWRGLGDAILLEVPDARPDSSTWAKQFAQQASEAIRAYQQAVRLRPGDEKAWKGLGEATGQGGDEPAAQVALEKAAQIDPSDAEVWEDLGMLYAGGRRFDDVLTAFDTARALIKPTDEKGWYKLGNLYLLIGESSAKSKPDARGALLEHALECANHAVKLRPRDPDTWSELGFVYGAQKDRAGVLKVYEKLKTLNKAAADAFFQDEVLPKSQ